MYIVTNWNYIGGYNKRYVSINEIAKDLGIHADDIHKAFKLGEMIEGYTIDKE